MEATQQRPLVRLNEAAPDFEANTTQGPIKLSDFKGKKWVVLFSHPADFTPVCTTEFIGFSNLHDDFVKRNVQLIGLSIDSVYAHLGWLQNIEQNFKVKVPFPVIADLDMKVASLYGMIHPGASSTATVRAVFIIDDKGILRAMVYYPLTTGRNMDEILRWKPGDKVIVAPPTSVAQLEEREKAGYEMIDWYFSKKSI